MAKLQIDRLKEVLSYDPTTGVFVWVKSTSPRVTIGDRAGVIAKNGRRYIAIDGEKFMAHRLAWFYAHGEWPSDDLRQKNEDFDDCSLANLEPVSRSFAARKRALGDRNKTGFRGVSINKRGKFDAFITREYKQVYLGTFDTAEDASAAYNLAASEFEPAQSLEDKKAAAESAKIRRRLRVAWEKLEGRKTEWSSFSEFSDTVKDVPPRHSVVPVETDVLMGPNNFRCEPDLSTGFDLSTRDGRIAYFRAHRKHNPDVYKERELRKHFDIGLSEFNKMLAEQNGGCAICSMPESAVRNDKEMALAVDHDHATGKIRGLLCGNCNKALGKFKDDPEIIRNAIVYLAKHSSTVDVSQLSPDRDWLPVATLGFGA